MRGLAKVVVFSVLVAGCLSCGSIVRAQTYDLQTDFSDNQNGPWNYQRLEGGVYTNLTYFEMDAWGIDGFNGWKYQPTGGFPAIMQNQSGADVWWPWGPTYLLDGQIAVHPGSEKPAGSGNWIAAAVRWTAPASGVYEVYGRFGWLSLSDRLIQIFYLPAGGGSPVKLYEYTTPADPWDDQEYTGSVPCFANDAIAYIVDSNETWGSDFMSMAATITRTGPLLVGKIYGELTLEGFHGDLSLTPVRFELLKSGSLVKSQDITFTANPGTYSLENLMPDTYELRVSASTWLRQVLTGVVVGESEMVKRDVTLPAGDVDGDGEVSTTDLSGVIANLDKKSQ